LTALSTAVASAPAAVPMETKAAPEVPHERPTRRSVTAAAIIIAMGLSGAAVWWQSRTKPTSAKIHEPDPQAQHLYIRGRYLMDRQTEQGIRAGIAAFEEAVARDPRFAAAYAGLSDGYNQLSQFGFMAPSEAMQKARRAAEQALDLDPNLAEGHVSLAAVLEAYDWNWKGAEREYRRGPGLNPYLPARPPSCRHVHP